MKACKLILVFTLVLCLLAGCVGNPNPPGGSNPGSTAATPPPTPAPTPEPTPEPTTEPTQEPEVDYVLPGYDENFFDLACEDVEYVLHLNSGSFSSLKIPVFFVSAQRLRKGDVRITTNLGKVYEPKLAGEVQAENLDMPVFLSYQGFDWKSHAQLELESPEEADKKENQYYLSYVDARKALRSKPLYGGVLTLPLSELLPAEYFDENGRIKLPDGTDTLEIQEITVTVKGQSKTYHPKRLCITSKPLELSGGAGGLHDLGGNPQTITPSSDGTFTGMPLAYRTTEDVILTGLALPEHPDSQILSCQLRIDEPGKGTIEMDWDGKTPVQLAAGSLVVGELSFTMPQWAGKLCGSGTMYVSVAFEQDGVKGYSSNQMLYTVTSSAYEYYAQKYDGIDMVAYYRDYLSVVGTAK